MIDPRFMDVVEWTDRMAMDLPFVSERLLDADEWRSWARNVIRYPQISIFNPPDPDFFEDWRKWAERFNQIVEP